MVFETHDACCFSRLCLLTYNIVVLLRLGDLATYNDSRLSQIFFVVIFPKGVCKKLRDLLDAMVERSQSLLIQKNKSSQAIPNLPILVPRLPTGMLIRIVNQIAPPFYLSKSCLCFSEQNQACVLEILFFF